MTKEIDNLFSPPRLLLGESAEQFASLRAELMRDIKPKGIVEKIYVYDLAALVWDIVRFRRLQTDIILNARPAALLTILRQLLAKINFPHDIDGVKAKTLTRAWFENSADKIEVQKLLEQFGLDEGAIDAEAYRIVFAELQELNRMLASAEARFSKTLRSIADYRKSFAQQAESSAVRILAENDVPGLEPMEYN
jgi:hypothetical protein